MPARKKARKDVGEEQVLLLRQIIVELQRLNASLAAGKTGAQRMIESGRPLQDAADDEELEEYE